MTRGRNRSKDQQQNIFQTTGPDGKEELKLYISSWNTWETRDGVLVSPGCISSWVGPVNWLQDEILTSFLLKIPMRDSEKEVNLEKHLIIFIM